MRFLRRWFILTSTLLLIFGVIKPAYADPHAMFYTSIGQQQLFFNTLAALDQADYVETSGERTRLLQERAAAGQAPENHPTVKETRSDLSNILTRGVTLEGHDLWTSYQYFQLALESKRRVATAELMRKYCQHSVGIVGCDPSDADNLKREEALIGGTDPVSYENKPVTRGVFAALTSGLERDQKVRQKISEETGNSEPYEYDKGIAGLRTAAGTDEQKNSFLNSLLGGVLGSWLPTPIYNSLYTNVEINSEGRVQPKYTLGSSNGVQGSTTLEASEYIDTFTNDLAGLFSNSMAVQEAAMAAASRVEAVQDTDTDGFLSDKELRVPKADVNKKLGRLPVRVTSPAEARAAEVHAIKEGTANLDSNQTSAPSSGENQPGTVPFVARGGNNNGAVEGISTTQLSTSETPQSPSAGQGENGQVQGIFTDALAGLFGFYDQPQEPTSPNANPIPAHEEEGLAAANDALDDSFTDKDDAISDGFWEGVLDDFCNFAPILCGE